MQLRVLGKATGLLSSTMCSFLRAKRIIRSWNVFFPVLFPRTSTDCSKSFENSFRLSEL